MLVKPTKKELTKYCPKCGEKLEVIREPNGFSFSDGSPIFNYYGYCPNRTKSTLKKFWQGFSLLYEKEIKHTNGKYLGMEYTYNLNQIKHRKRGITKG